MIDKYTCFAAKTMFFFGTVHLTFGRRTLDFWGALIGVNRAQKVALERYASISLKSSVRGTVHSNCVHSFARKNFPREKNICARKNISARKISVREIFFVRRYFFARKSFFARMNAHHWSKPRPERCFGKIC